MNELNMTRRIWIGVGLICLSSCIYILGNLYPERDSSLPNVFFLNYFCAFAYFLFLAVKLRWNVFSFMSARFRPELSLLVILYNLSAFSLNQHIIVFFESTDWLFAFILLENILLCCYALLNNTPGWLKLAGSIVFIPAALLHVYQMVTLLPLIPYAAIGIIVLGIGLHAFVPLFSFLLILGYLLSFAQNKRAYYVMIASFVMVFSISVAHIYEWVSFDERIKKVVRAPWVEMNSADLPNWIRIAQSNRKNTLARKYLMQGIFLQDKSNNLQLRINRDMPLRHDPFVVLASLFTDERILNREDKMRILNIRDDFRHETADRFWSGDHLETGEVDTEVRLFPEERLSHTIQTMVIVNNSREQNRPQEALYTFQLPEGGVISDLSLWVDGRERKARLTTPEKADTAYSTIVGYEIRDPAVVFWMEGNQVRVRVFPCTPHTPRKFRLGITAPLTFQNGRLIYEAPRFKGPSPGSALHTVRVHDTNASIRWSAIPFTKTREGFSWQGNWRDQWSLTIDAVEISPVSIPFKDKTYALVPYSGPGIPAGIDQFVVDLSDAFSEKELERILKLSRGLQTYYTDFAGQLRPFDSVEDIFKTTVPEFSMFPFHLPIDYSRTLIITKSRDATPNLEDIKGSGFHKALREHFAEAGHTPLVFDLGNTRGLYLSSLHEIKAIRLIEGTLADLEKRFLAGNIAGRPGDLIPVASSGAAFRVSTNEIPIRQASDRLVRLFLYQKVIEKYGRTCFSPKKNLDSSVSDMAARAHVVTPVSSLIVLETDKDYERFEIDEATDSLGNASLENAGAVPEPHEWALIISGLIMLLWVMRRKVNLGSI